jgi:hypothetical protein
MALVGLGLHPEDRVAAFGYKVVQGTVGTQAFAACPTMMRQQPGGPHMFRNGARHDVFHTVKRRLDTNFVSP